VTSPADPAPPFYRTDLAETPLPEILVKIDHYKVPGRLECRRGDEVFELAIDRGEIVSASGPIETLFSWANGAATFIPGRGPRHFELLHAPLPIRQAILRGVMRMPDARFLLSRIGTKSTLLQRTDVPLDVALSGDEQALLDAADGKRALFEIVNHFGNPAANARALYGLFVLGFLSERERRHIRVQLKAKTTPA